MFQEMLQGGSGGSSEVKKDILSQEIIISTGFNIEYPIDFTEDVEGSALLLIFATDINKGADLRYDATILYCNSTSQASYFNVYERRSNSMIMGTIHNGKISYFSGTLNSADYLKLLHVYKLT